uniref:Myb/SANT-like DNA-binding domain-containing protein n=1 Tax=Magallana gigas TaxID=29159 RepID=A0A8W8JXF8_MAGGI
MSSESKKRKPNWTDDEMKILTSCVIENKDVLFAKLSASVTNEKKKALWEDITKHNSETNNLALSCTAVPSEISAGMPSFIVEEVDVPEEAPSVHVSGPSTDTFLASTLYGSKRKDTASDPDAAFMLNLIEVKKERRAIAEERKADALERIAAAFEKKFGI